MGNIPCHYCDDEQKHVVYRCRNCRFGLCHQCMIKLYNGNPNINQCPACKIDGWPSFRIYDMINKSRQEHKTKVIVSKRNEVEQGKRAWFCFPRRKKK